MNDIVGKATPLEYTLPDPAPSPDAPALLGSLDLAVGREAVRQRMFGTATATQLGRFTVVRTLGYGAMGRVYQGHDPQLHRMVALKLVDAADPERMMREARALARVQHPNVAAVYEVGLDGRRCFIAMELVRGLSIDQWLRAERRSASAVFDVFLQAGEGLAAAHAAGLVHGDFKPPNAVVGRSGRVRVIDFGLARAMVHRDDTLDDADGDREGTRPGGTPAYMPPEQHDGVVDPRCDQYAFAMALAEALTGDRPPITEPAAWVDRCSLPPRVRRVLCRALARDPHRRFVAMRPLLRALIRTTGAWRRRAQVAVVTVAAVLGTGLGLTGVAADAAARRPSTCDGDDPTWQLWSPQRVATLRGRFGDGDEHIRALGERVITALDNYAQGLHDERSTVCDAELTTGPVAEAHLRCLQAGRAQLDATLALLDDDEPMPGGFRALAALAMLPPVEDCRQQALQVDAQEPPQATALRNDLAYAHVQFIAGDFAEAKAAAQTVAQRAAAHGLTHLELSARLMAAESVVERGGLGPASAVLRQIISDAAARRDLLLEAKAWITLIKTEAIRRGDYSNADALLFGARVAAERVPRFTQVAMDLALAEGTLLSAMGRLPRAEQRLREGLAMGQQRLGPDDPQLALFHNNLGNLLWQRGELEQAGEQLRRSRVISETWFGPMHPHVLETRANQGALLLVRGDLHAAQAMLDSTLKDALRALPASHRLPPLLRQNLGIIASDLGDPQLARQHYEAALQAHVRVDGGDSPASATLMVNIASLDLHRPRVALARLDAAVEIFGAHDDQSRSMAIAQLHRARALAALNLDAADAAAALAFECIERGPLPWLRDEYWTLRGRLLATRMIAAATGDLATVPRG